MFNQTFSSNFNSVEEASPLKRKCQLNSSLNVDSPEKRRRVDQPNSEILPKNEPPSLILRTTKQILENIRNRHAKVKLPVSVEERDPETEVGTISL
jgi:hypothetical protein